MSRLHIPRLGTEIVLAEDWAFPLFDEYRNQNMQSAVGLRTPQQSVDDFWQLSRGDRTALVSRTKWRLADGTLPDQSHEYSHMCHPLTIPAGALLTIDRIFIRKGAPDFDSVTFWLKAKQTPVTINGRALKRSVRFWAKLDDVNRIEVRESS
ncbi:hypothetical protein SB778_03930 [Paraburkholderia sp. SIMBA_050]